MAVELRSIVGSPVLHKLSIGRRQCRYVNESSLRYYPHYYTENLCYISCRIQMALKLCNCVPFFYYASKWAHMPATEHNVIFFQHFFLFRWKIVHPGRTVLFIKIGLVQHKVQMPTFVRLWNICEILDQLLRMCGICERIQNHTFIII